MKADLTIIPKAIIHPDKIIIYNEILWEPCKPSKRTSSEFDEPIHNKADHLQKYSRTAEGKISKIARKKIGKALDYLLLLATEKKELNRLTGKFVKFKIAFITLTLPSQQIHSDNEIKSKCLNSFIIELTKFYKVKNYIWRAEKQQNGNLHFHIIIDKFVPWSEIRDRWNRIVNKLGYVDRYREQLKTFHANGFNVRKDLLKQWDYKAQVKAYQKGKANDFNNPNSTDIHSARHIKNMKAYICKYLTKNDSPVKLDTAALQVDQVQQGRVWSCNQELSNIKGCLLDIDSEVSECLKKITDSKKFKFYQSDYFSVLYIDFEKLLSVKADPLFAYFITYLELNFNFNYQYSLIA
jgi:hypothetical protein